MAIPLPHYFKQMAQCQGSQAAREAMAEYHEEIEHERAQDIGWFLRHCQCGSLQGCIDCNSGAFE